MAILFDNPRVFLDGVFFPLQKVLIEKGKIAGVGSKILKNVDETIDGQKKYLVPGLIDAHSHIGLFDHGHGRGGQDLSEFCSPVNPQLRPLDGIKMRDRSLEDARHAGVTTCLVTPASDTPISGQCSILKTYGNSADVGLIVEQAGIKISFGEEPKFPSRREKKFPSTRMGISAIIRETFMKAQDYFDQKQSKKGLKDRSIQMESLMPLFEGRVPLRAHANRLEDIMAAIRIAEEFKFRIIIEHGAEAHKIAALLAEKKIPVVVAPTLIPQLRFELRDKVFEAAVILLDAGVEVALTCDYPGLPLESLRIAAAMAVQYGLDEKRAMMCITEYPARILGIANRVGQIKKGFDADVALFSGHPLDLRSKLEMVVIDGEIFKF